ncbi:flavin reductase [Pigmentiphaga sp. YJ18]|uniref:flavin reductase n=1 Tax=unclassified Pigmentiphaga TaxID=2626614 RepID=UPI001375D890|nr:flavin reductase [Pigmentiphaga sp. H8]
MNTIDPAALRRCLGSFVTGVTVVTAIDRQGGLQGMTANSFTSVSLDPPLIVWSLRTSSSSFEAYRGAKRFVVNILAQDQVHVSNLFARPGEGRFDAIAWSGGLGGVPLIEGCAAHLECCLEATYPGGDHVLFLGRVENIVTNDRKPLAFGLGKYMVVQPHDHQVDLSGSVAELGAVHAARGVLDEVFRKTDLTVGLGVWGNMGPTMIWFNESSRPLDLKLRCGMVMPLLGSATGKVFAAFGRQAEMAPRIEAELQQAWRVGHESGLRDEAEHMLAQVRATRVAAVRDSLLNGVFERRVHAVSVPVFDARGAIVLALTMMSHDDGFGQDHPAVDVLKSAGRELSGQLGFAG